MYIKTFCRICAVMMVFLLCSSLAFAKDLGSLFDQVEKLKIERHGYILGAVLNQEQMKTAESDPVDTDTPDTFKFRDKNLFVIAQKISNRVLVIYEQFEDAAQPKAQDLIGDLFMNFEDPTIMAHDKVVYWAYTKKGIITTKEFDTAKQDKKKLNIIATVKFISELNIMEKIKESEPAKGQIYYIISSDPILKFFKDKQ